MDTAISIIAIILGVTGIVGSVVPGIPGPPVSWIGLLMLYFRGGVLLDNGPVSLVLLLVMLAVTTFVTLLDFIFPSKMTRLTGGSRYASRGALAGMVAGILLTPIGMILGCFLGAILSEMYWGGKPWNEALKASLGAFVGVITGTGAKLAASGIMMWFIVLHA